MDYVRDSLTRCLYSFWKPTRARSEYYVRHFIAFVRSRIKFSWWYFVNIDSMCHGWGFFQYLLWTRRIEEKHVRYEGPHYMDVSLHRSVNVYWTKSPAS